MSRQRTLIRNVLKLYQKAGLSLLAMGMSASVLANQLPQGPQINQKISARLVLNARGDATQAAQLSPHRPAGNGVKSVPTASDQIDRFKTSGNPSETISRYLWDGAKTSEPKLSRYLWDGAKTSEAKLSRYLWDGAKTSELKLSRYLWDGAKTPEIELSRVLWTAEKASEWQSASRRWVPMPVAAEQGEYDPRFARFLWREFDPALPDTQPKSGGLDDLMGQDYPAFLLDPRLQVASTDAMLSPTHRTQQIALTGLNYSAKSAATLEFEGQIVRWSLVNQGLKPLEFSTLDLTVPDGAALTSVVIKQPGLAPIDLGVDGSRLRLDGALHPGTAATVEVGFAEAPSRDESQYGFNLAFKNGQTIEFLSRRNLPIQGERRDSFFPTLIRADELHRAGLTGRGVGVAVIDTGAWAHPALALNTEGQSRVLSFYDAIKNEEGAVMVDENGHGSHITSVLASSEASYDQSGTRTGSYHGIAPDVDLVVVKAFNDESKSTYLDVVSAIAYVVKHRDRFNIKVLTLAFQGDAVSHYWQDPINQAVMAAWDAGITVVVSAGNSGPDAMTIGAPGNVPYVITVGAVTDHYTMDDQSDDYVATFSSVGPTLEGFAKPEMTAPGGHMMGLIPEASTVTFEHPEFHDGYHYYLMSGTSQAAAAASGVAALMLQDDPSLSPNDVKCRLMASARLATKNGQHTFSVLQQGAGLIDAVAAVASKETGCANQGLDLKSDIAGRRHFKGPFNSRAQIEKDLALEDSDQLVLSSTTAVFHQAASETEAVLRAFNTVSVFDEAALKREGQYVTLESLAANNLNWEASDLVSQGYLLNRSFQGLEQLAFDGQFGIDAQLLSSYLIGLKAHHGGVSDTGSSFSQAGFIWNLSSPENAGFIWNLANPENAGFIWNLSSPENAGFIWNLANPENAGFIWNLSSPENAGFIWNLTNPENAGFIWNLANPENAGFIWNLSSPENAGFIWNLTNPENAGFIWNLANPENAGFIWNLSSPENAGFIWNLSSPENAGFIWNLSSPENAGFIWNLASPENAGFIWNLSSPENAGFIWNLASPENTGFIWNLSSPENAGFIWNLSSPENAGFIWNLSSPENAGFIWNLASPENAGFIWNLSSLENAGFIWNLSNPENAGFIWNL